MYRIAICDDEPMFAEQLEALVKIYLARRELAGEVELFSGGEDLLAAAPDFHILLMDLRLPVSTGNAVLDVLLGEKISFARDSGIQAVCRVSVPEALPIDEMDLCTVFANGLDNAIAACLEQKDCRPEIDVSARVKHDFLLIQLKNSVSGPVEVRYGTGLNNMKQIVEKYSGTMEIQSTDNAFCLNILLCLNH